MMLGGGSENFKGHLNFQFFKIVPLLIVPHIHALVGLEYG
jgi:hypothetical protein